MSLSEQNRALIERRIPNVYTALTDQHLNLILDAARAEGDPAAEGDIPSIIERGQTGERLSPTEQSAWTGYELGWKDGLKHAISDLGECFECGHDLRGPYCPACNPDMGTARTEGVAALQQAGDLISRENLEAELRETIGLYVREAVTRMFSEENATYRCARQIAGMLQPGYYLHRKLFSSPLPQQTALVEPYSPDLDDVNGRLA